MKAIPILITLAILGSLGAGGWYWQNNQHLQVAAAAASAASAPRPPQPVSVFAAQKRDVPIAIEATGTVVALQAVDVRAQVTGTIAEVKVRDGQFVRKGEMLLKLDDRADRANLERARAQLQRDQAAMADLERQWKRAQELRAQNFIAPSAADTVLSQVESQRALIAADQAAVRSAEVQLSYASIAAPFTGRAGAVNVSTGSLVTPNNLVMVNINQIDPIGVAFTVPESQLSGLLRAANPKGPGVEFAVSIPGSERAPRNAPPPEPITGKVVFVDNAVDTATGTIRVKGELANAKQRLWPGQYVSVRMTLRTLTDAVVVPQAALIIRGNERAVYVVKADGTVDLRNVQPRAPAGEFIAVDGLQPGERVVVEGKQNLRPGSTVRESAFVPGAGRRGGGGGAGAGSGAASGAGRGAAPDATDSGASGPGRGASGSASPA